MTCNKIMHKCNDMDIRFGYYLQTFLPVNLGCTYVALSQAVTRNSLGSPPTLFALISPMCTTCPSLAAWCMHTSLSVFCLEILFQHS